MPRIKFGSRIRKSFRRKGSGDTNDEASLITEQVLRSLQPVPSDVSTSSLCSDVRDHGPIDVDDCKKYKNRRGKVGNKKVYDRSRKENNLPRISEGGSSTPNGRSRPTTPSSSSGSRPVTPVTHIDGVNVGGKSAGRNSPADDQTVSTLNGKDVFERNRSSDLAASRVGSVAGSRKSSRSVPVAGPNSSKITSRSQPRAKAASPKARGLIDSMAALVAPTENVNAPEPETTTSANGLDIFESSRLALDSFGAKPPTTPTAQPRHGSGSPITTNIDPNAPGRAPSPNLGSNRARNATPSFVISPRAASPSLASMFSQPTPRSTTPSSANDRRAVSDEVPLKRSLTPARRDKYDTSRDKYDGPGSLFGDTPSSGRPKSIPTGPSPTGVADVFHAEFPVEFDVIENKETDKYSLAEVPSEKGRAAQLMSSKQKPPALPLSKRKGVQSPPKNNRLRPAKASHQHQLNTSLENIMAAHAARGLDNPDVYTSLEDAMAAHAAMLTNDAKGKAIATGSNRSTVKTPSKDFSTDDSVCSNVTEVLDSARPKAPSNTKNTTTNPEFCTKKKNAEKGEFKKVVLVKKKDGKTGLIGPLGPQEAIEVQATRKVEPFSDAAKKESGVKGSNGTAGMQRRDSMDPPGIDKTNTKSPVSPNPLFVEDTMNTPQLPKKMPRANTPRPKPVDVIATKTKTVDEVPQQAVGDAGADVGQSFSFELGNFDVGVQHSLSDDGSCASYYSDLESIDSITICEETTRLLEMRDRYEKDAHTNKWHPSRIKPSIMKAGSIFRTDSVNAIKDGKKAGYGRSNRSSSRKVSTKKGQAAAVAKRKLTWYDDEENWNKPFTLRTDESFDGTTISSDFREMTVGGIIRTNVVGEFFGDFMKGIGLPTCGGEEDVTSVDPALEQEI